MEPQIFAFSTFDMIRTTIASACVDSTTCDGQNMDPRGEKYNGCVNVTVSGRKCQVGEHYQDIVWLRPYYLLRLGLPLPLTTMVSQPTKDFLETIVAILTGGSGHGDQI